MGESRTKLDICLCDKVHHGLPQLQVNSCLLAAALVKTIGMADDESNSSLELSCDSSDFDPDEPTSD